MINFSPKSYVVKCCIATIFLIFATVSFCYSQTDTIFTNNEKLACSVKEVTPDAVKYTFPGEDLINTVYKNTIQKIIFKNGRVQTFAESTSYKSVNGVMDYDKVTITTLESEVMGLYKIGELSAESKGKAFSSKDEEKTKDIAYRKLKIEAAMFGANVVYLSNQRTKGNTNGYYNISPAETNLTGIAYSNMIPNFDNFKKLVGTQTNFSAFQQYKLGEKDKDVSQDNIEKPFRIFNISNDNGIIYIDGALKGETNINRFQLVNFTSNNFSIAYKYEGTAYNIVIKVN